MAFERFSSPEQERLEDLQTHARVLAFELRVAGISYSTVFRKDSEEVLSDGWEIPSEEVPSTNPLVLSAEGLFVSDGPRVQGRSARPIDVREVSSKGAGKAVRQRLYNMEKRHDIFEKLKNIQEGDIGE